MWLNGIEFIPPIVRWSFHSTVVKNFNYKLANLLKSQQVSLHMCTIIMLSFTFCWTDGISILGWSFYFICSEKNHQMNERTSVKAMLIMHWLFLQSIWMQNNECTLFVGKSHIGVIHTFIWSPQKSWLFSSKSSFLSFPWGYLAISPIPLPRILVP